MRIISGYLRRRQLKAPKGQITRPTTDRVRESLFNMLASRIDFEEADVLDLFAGTGALGFEAISRGAAAATLIDVNPRVMRVCRENAIQLDVEESCVFFQVDAVSFLKSYSGPSFNVIFADPPYELTALPKLPDAALAHLSSDGAFVLEHDQTHSF